MEATGVSGEAGLVALTKAQEQAYQIKKKGMPPILPMNLVGGVPTKEDHRRKLQTAIENVEQTYGRLHMPKYYEFRSESSRHVDMAVARLRRPFFGEIRNMFRKLGLQTSAKFIAKQFC